tara:strand:- start:225 stop:770 length:546 start_codon:yes stop_codon:yes gene_type:complete
MAKKISKNLQKVKDQLDGTYKGKIQVGMHTSEDVHANRKVGDKWTDSDGVEWEQKQGYRSKISKLAAKGLGDKCSDCEKLIITGWDKDVYKWNKRCYYCQIDYEAQFPKAVNGQYRTEYNDYLEKRYKNFKEDYIKKFEEEHADIVEEIKNLENPFDTKVANALANANVDTTIKVNKNKLK